MAILAFIVMGKGWLFVKLSMEIHTSTLDNSYLYKSDSSTQ